MRRVLIVIEDYNELLFLEAVLKKVGFDVATALNEKSLLDLLLSFKPELLIATGGGSKVSAERIAPKTEPQTKILPVFPKKIKPKTVPAWASGIEESPLNPRSLLAQVCKLLNIPPGPILAKFDKLSSIANENLSVVIVSGKSDGGITSFGGGGAQAVKTSKYSDRLKDVLSRDPGLIVTTNEATKETSLRASLDRKKVQEEINYQKQIADSSLELKVDEDRKTFVKKLFTGWKRK